MIFKTAMMLTITSVKMVMMMTMIIIIKELAGVDIIVGVIITLYKLYIAPSP